MTTSASRTPCHVAGLRAPLGVALRGTGKSLGSMKASEFNSSNLDEIMTLCLPAARGIFKNSKAGGLTEVVGYETGRGLFSFMNAP